MTNDEELIELSNSELSELKVIRQLTVRMGEMGAEREILLAKFWAEFKRVHGYVSYKMNMIDLTIKKNDELLKG